VQQDVADIVKAAGRRLSPVLRTFPLDGPVGLELSSVPGARNASFAVDKAILAQ
jgi:hypothetical protein